MEKPKYYNEARNKAAQKYISANLEMVQFRVKKGEKALIQEAAAQAGQSMAQYIIQAINSREGRQIITPSDKEV